MVGIFHDYVSHNQMVFCKDENLQKINKVCCTKIDFHAGCGFHMPNALTKWVPIVAQQLGQIGESKDQKNTTCVSGSWFGTFFLFSISYMGCHPSH